MRDILQPVEFSTMRFMVDMHVKAGHDVLRYVDPDGTERVECETCLHRKVPKQKSHREMSGRRYRECEVMLER